MKRPILRRIALISLVLAGVGIVGVALILLNVDRLAREAAILSLARKTGTGIRLDGLELGLRNQTLRLRNLVISNPPGFGPEALLALPELYLAYDPEAAATNALRFREVRLHLAELNLAVDDRGRTNVMVLAAASAGPEHPVGTNLLPNGFNFQGIDRLTLTLGRLGFTDARDPRQNKRFNLGVTNRTLLNVNSLEQLLPLAVEIYLKGGLELGLPLPPSGNRPSPR